MPPTVSPALRALVESQYGLATRAQLEAELSRAGIETLRRRGILVPSLVGVWRFSGREPSWRQNAMAACLAFGPPVALHGMAAARLWGWKDIGTPPIAVAVPRPRSGRRRSISAVRVGLAGDEITWHDGIPVTTAPRTVLDVARRLSDRQIESFLDHLLESSLATVPDIERYLDDRDPDSTSSVQSVRHLVALRSDHPQSESAWEDRLWGWLRDAGLPTPVRQYEVVVGTARYRLDLAYPEQRVAIEFDGWAWHRGRRRFDSDRERTTELELAGWLVVLVTSAHDRQASVARVRRALDQRGHERGGAPGPEPG